MLELAMEFRKLLKLYSFCSKNKRCKRYKKESNGISRDKDYSV